MASDTCSTSSNHTPTIVISDTPGWNLGQVSGSRSGRHPQHEFILMDVLGGDEQLPIFDYVVLNGVFNYRGPIDRDEMMRYGSS